MTAKFEKISGNDAIFSNPEYTNDSIIFNSIESARKEENYHIYSDHKNVIILASQTSNRVWIWTSSTIKDDTNKLIDICRFLRDFHIPKAEIYLKQDVSHHFSDIYAITTSEINYVVKDEFSLAVLTFTQKEAPKPTEEKIILLDKNRPDHVKLARDFYEQLKEEFRWTDKFERKLEEYLNMELYALVKNNQMIAGAVIGGITEKFLRIKSIAVLPQNRKQGFGYQMCLFSVNQIKERGLTPILYAHVGNKAAMALWAKTGFKEYNKLYLLKIEDNQ